MPESRDDLGKRLELARKRQQPVGSTGSGGQPDAAIGLGARSGIEFVAALVVSVGLGILIDRWLGTTPVALLIFVALGFAAGLLNVYRAINGMSYADGYDRLKLSRRDAATDENGKDED